MWFPVEFFFGESDVWLADVGIVRSFFDIDNFTGSIWNQFEDIFGQFYYGKFSRIANVYWSNKVILIIHHLVDAIKKSSIY